MREIKFRAWSPSLGGWCGAFSIHKNGYISSLIDAEIDKDSGLAISDAHWGENDLIIEQYTGLKDKNGKEIYEGDIVKYTSVTKYDPLNNRMVYVGQIQNWSGQMGVGFRYKSGRHTMMLKLGHSFNMEVIGNIHENEINGNS